MTRSEAFDEYYKLAGFVQAYDGYFLSIKAWGVTVTSAAIGAGFSASVSASRTSQVVVFLVAALLAGSFWATEVMMKLLQVAHVYRLSELEDALLKAVEIEGPAYLTSFTEGQKLDRFTKRWRRVAFFPHVVFPHAVFLAVSATLVVLAAVNIV